MTIASLIDTLGRAVHRRRKLVVVAAAILLPVILLSAVVVRFCTSDIAVARKELTGTVYLRRAWGLVSACDAGAPAAGWGSAPNGGPSQIIAGLEETGHRLEAEQARIPPADGACDHARGFLKRIADETTLTLDPRTESYYLMAMTVNDLPALGGRGAALDRLVGAGDRSAQARAAIHLNAGLLRDARAAVMGSAAEAGRGADASVETALALPLVRLSESVERYADAADSLASGETAGAVARQARTQGLAREMKGATDSVWVVAVNQLERLLLRRIAVAQATLWLALTGAAVLVAAAIVALVWYDLYTQREEVMHLNESLRQSNEELERFAYICSHDMQEPVRMMSLYAEMLMEDAAPRLDEADRRHVDFIVRNSRVMKSMISDILIFSRVGRDPIVFQTVDSAAILRDVLLEMQPDIARLSARVTLEGLPVLRTNATLVRLLFQNLVGNALKFQSARSVPEIAITAAFVDGAWRFEVRDNGIGIDERYRDEVFAIFRRLHTREEFPGNGIGLSTCRKFLGLVGGTIDFSSTPGQGTTFVFTLPDARTSSAAAQR